ncbi:hypothetical protein [Rhodomicrobium udaipurense]|uniref:Uncharacterized protein n=1 Tax=Rhodomicrobium udaipurense TaxID=1202716 RepID=A0A8I1KLD0_9HYPH|nr:hypothetical protein [Rhodomicrobium udaipurense]MBJ7545214.1 hypothetical protein [Rhodomicrobium udaipurense]
MAGETSNALIKIIPEMGDHIKSNETKSLNDRGNQSPETPEFWQRVLEEARQGGAQAWTFDIRIPNQGGDATQPETKENLTDPLPAIKEKLQIEVEKHRRIRVLTNTLFVATIFQSIVIYTFWVRGAEATGPTPVEAVIEVQDEAIRTLQFEINRLRRRQQSSKPSRSSCAGVVNDTLDQLGAQVQGRLMDLFNSQAKQLLTRTERPTTKRLECASGPACEKCRY